MPVKDENNMAKTVEDNVSLLGVRVGALEVRFDKIEAAMGRLTDAVTASKNVNWPLIISIISACAIFLSGGWYLISLKTENTVAPVAADTMSSKIDRGELRKGQEGHAQRITQLEGAVVEIETQHRANSQIRNLMMDHQQQLLAILWEEVKKTPLPKNGYYPDISLPHPSPK